MTDPQELSQDLLNRLAQTGELPPAWSEAFAAVPRHRFIPETIWRIDDVELVPLHRIDDPQEWMRCAYGPASVITQVDDGYPAGPGPRGRYITSSASQPNVVALMLDALDAQPGMRVLEIGTGTGYNAALLAHRLGTGKRDQHRNRPRSRRARSPCACNHRLSARRDYRRRSARLSTARAV